MANEISYRNSATGATLYTTIRSAARTYWNTSGATLEALTVANWADYDIALAETPASSYFYVGDWPTGLTTVGWYWLDIYTQAGGTPAITDTLAATVNGYWDGTTFSPLSSGSFPGSLYGTGSEVATATVTIGGLPLAGTALWITTDIAGANIVAGTVYTNAFGQAVFYLDIGSYYIWTQHAGYNFTNPTAFSIVAGTNTISVTGTAAAAPNQLPGHTIRQVIEEIARVFGMYERTATGGTTSAIIDSALVRFANDYWVNASAYVKETTDTSTPEGEEQFVVDFDSATGTLTVSPAFTAAVDAGDVYQLYRFINREDAERATMRAIAGVEVATTLIPRNDTIDYVLNCTGLYRRQQMLHVYVRPHNDVTVMPIQVQGWHLEDAEGVLTLRMPYLLNTDDGFWITYTMGEGEDMDVGTWNAVPVAEDYHVNAPMGLLRARGVVYCLENMLMVQDMAGIEKFGRLLTDWRAKLQEEENKYQRPVRKVRGYPWYLNYGDSGDYAMSRLGIG